MVVGGKRRGVSLIRPSFLPPRSSRMLSNLHSGARGDHPRPARGTKVSLRTKRSEQKIEKETPPPEKKAEPLQEKKKNSFSFSSLTAVSSEAILAPLGSVVTSVTGAGAPDDEAGVGSTRPGKGSVIGTPEEKKRSEEAAAAAIGATPTAEEDKDDDEASAEAAARPARGSSPDSREAALDDETMFFEFGRKAKERRKSSSSRERVQL